MKRVVQYSMDILIRNEEENAINLEELIAEALEEKGLYICGVSFTDDMTEYYPELIKEQEEQDNKEKVWICVYRDTIEQHDDNNNLTEVLVTREFAEQYFNELKTEDWNNFEEFLSEYTADDTEDFYEYAMKHKAVIKKENW